MKTLIFMSVLTILSCSRTDCEEKVKVNCAVTFELNPVCGCNEKTYPNPSSAKCNGIEKYTLGECK